MPETQFARIDARPVAYQVMGDGPDVLVAVWGYFSDVEALHSIPGYTSFLERLAQNCRVVTFDVTGMGRSDRTRVPTFVERMDDLVAVIDAVGADRATLLGTSSGGALALAFAAAYPERTDHLLLYGTYPTFLRTEEIVYMVTPEILRSVRSYAKRWGLGRTIAPLAPSLAVTDDGPELWRSIEQASMEPAQAVESIDVDTTIDVTPVLRDVQAPTLVMHRVNEQFVPPQSARYLARSIPGARLVLFDGVDHLPWLGNATAILKTIERFLAGEQMTDETDMTAVLITDISRSTELILKLGDERWSALVAQHDEISRSEVESAGGRLIKLTGDGILAVFDHPAEALRCAVALREAIAGIDLGLKAGVTVGDVIFRGSDVSGLCVHIAERIAKLAEPGQIFVSRGVTIVLSESTFEFVGTRTLRGIPAERSVFELK